MKGDSIYVAALRLSNAEWKGVLEKERSVLRRYIKGHSQRAKHLLKPRGLKIHLELCPQRACKLPPCMKLVANFAVSIPENLTFHGHYDFLLKKMLAEQACSVADLCKTDYRKCKRSSPVFGLLTTYDSRE